MTSHTGQCLCSPLSAQPLYLGYCPVHPVLVPASSRVQHLMSPSYLPGQPRSPYDPSVFPEGFSTPRTPPSLQMLQGNLPTHVVSPVYHAPQASPSPRALDTTFDSIHHTHVYLEGQPFQPFSTIMSHDNTLFLLPGYMGNIPQPSVDLPNLPLEDRELSPGSSPGSSFSDVSTQDDDVTSEPSFESHVGQIAEPQTGSQININKWNVCPTKVKHDAQGRRRSEGKFACSLGCGATFTKNHNLKSHFLSHMGIKPFKCEHCKQEFTRKHDARRHERRFCRRRGHA